MSLSFLLPFLCLLISTHSFYEGIDYINTELNQHDFAEQVIRSPSVWIIEFYAPWCQHCRNFQSDFQMAAENLKGIVNFGAIDCDVEEYKPLCGHFKIETLPTVYAFKPVLEQVELEGQVGLTKKPVKYQGPLKPASLVKWATSFLTDPHDPVLDVTTENIDKFLSNENWKTNKAILFSEKEKKSNLMRALALKFKIDYLSQTWLPIGQVSHTQQSLVERFGVTSFPTFIVVDEKGDIISRFDGEFTSSELSDFLKPYAYTPTEEDLTPKEKKKTTTPKESPKREIKLHHVTDQESFDSACFQLGLCLIAFLDPQAEEHKDYTNTLEELVKKHPSVQVIWLDGPKHESFKQAFGLAESYPQAVAYQRKALRYRIFMGGFETELLSEFIELVQGGVSKKGRVMVLEKEPEVKGEEKEDL